MKIKQVIFLFLITILFSISFFAFSQEESEDFLDSEAFMNATASEDDNQTSLTDIITQTTEILERTPGVEAPSKAKEHTDLQVALRANVEEARDLQSSQAVDQCMQMSCDPKTVKPQSLKWNIKKNCWDLQDQQNFEDFIAAVGEAKERELCEKLSDCLTCIDQASFENHYKKSQCKNVNEFKKILNGRKFYNQPNPDTLLPVFSDCADLPYVLRGYFAWKNGLGYEYPKSVTYANAKNEKKPDGNNRDIRYSLSGNNVTATTSIKNGDDINNVLKSTVNAVSTAMFRVHPKHQGKTGDKSDFYSPKISRESIRPGTVMYDPAGHVAVVYKVTKTGRIFLIDGHPDNSLTLAMYGAKFIRSRPAAGAGFKNWRPMEMTSENMCKPKGAEEIDDFSLEQYYGTNKKVDDDNWKKAEFYNKNGDKELYYDYVRSALTVGDARYDPVDELRMMLLGICFDIKDRVRAVASCRITDKFHPEKLPENIYGTEGEWETYSTPSRDARLKASMVEAMDYVKMFVEGHKNKNPKIFYEGSDLVGDLLKTYKEHTAKCKVSYTNSVGKKVFLNTDDVFKRVFNMSFDPYHCPELRWGATTPEELKSCQDSANKKEWYKAQSRLRNAHERDYEVAMDKTLEELKTSNLGSDKAANIDIKGYLESLIPKM